MELQTANRKQSGRSAVPAEQADRDGLAQISIPSIALPKGGGAIKSIDEKFRTNAANGTAALNIPLPFTPGRNNLTPAVGIAYNSGTGNGILGVGWSLDFPSIRHKTEKRIPTYREDEDVFTLAGADDLVPVLQWNNGEWIPEEPPADPPPGEYSITRYRPRVEGMFARIEKIHHPDHGTFWRVTTRDNVTTFFGCRPQTRIFDPRDENRIFEWLPELTFDDRGNCIVYDYKREDGTGVPDSLHEKNRKNGTARFTNLYLKRIRYGNTQPYAIDPDHPYFPTPVHGDFFFEAVFDYGEHDPDTPTPAETPGMIWNSRRDAFSSCRSGFDIRTHRLLKRVLMFHRFDELAGGQPYVVRSLDLAYELSSAHSPQQSELTWLASATQCGYIMRPDNTYSKKTLPPLEFDYAPLRWNTDVRRVHEDSIRNLPVGLGAPYRWMDLYGEGISGIFSEQANGWFYKSNRGDVEEEHIVHFDAMRPVAPKPSFTGVNTGVLQFDDLDTDGGRQIVVHHANGSQGFFELSDDNTWLPFRHFDTRATIDLRDPNLRLIDLNGDGKPDILVAEDDVFIWYESKGREGYAQSRRVAKALDEERGPAVVFADELQTIFLADMNGDGLADIVRIRNGEVCYWPNMGYGHFGAKVAMDNAPLFDHPDHFHSSYIQLADISGTGATDILYFGRNTCSAYLNISGNAWSDREDITPFPTAEQPNTISVVDLLGNGTACIVWSSRLPGNSGSPMRYIDLMGGAKPHLLTGYRNNLGKEVLLSYKSSTWFYLKDKIEGRPWLTKLPFPVHCVHRVETTDRIARSRFVAAYRFHHGYYDPIEREFRGFGMVEQTDTEDYEHWIKGNAGTIVDRSLHQPPVLTKTWFHTGVFTDRDTILAQFGGEYWHEEMNRQGFAIAVSEQALDDARLLAADGIDPAAIAKLSMDEWREALRACKGMVLRKEVFALDAPATGATADQLRKQLLPYTVETHNCTVELLQPRASGRHAVFLVKEGEAITYNYERDPDDPRITHTINILIDDVGNILESASIAYGRRTADNTLPGDIRDRQLEHQITYTKNRFTNDIRSAADYRLRVRAEKQTFEIKGLSAPQLYTRSDFDNVLASSTEIRYHQTDAVPPAGTVYRRLIAHEQSLFYSDDLAASLPLYAIARQAFPFESYKLAYTPELLQNIFGARATDDLLAEGKFTHGTGGTNWWIRSGIVHYLRDGESAADARTRFHVPVAYTDAYDATTSVSYFSTHFLLLEQTEDALHNRTRVEAFNLRTLTPRRIADPNDNIVEALFDELGFVKATAVCGKGNEADDLAGMQEYTTAAEQTATDNFFAAADSVQLDAPGRTLLGHASTRFVYDLHRYRNSGGNAPAVTASIVREQHHLQNNNPPVQMSFEYTDGHGQIAMKKIQAEPGMAKRVVVNPDDTYAVQDVDTHALDPKRLRWLGNGRTVLNNKGNIAQQYEPYFSLTHHFEDLKELVETGVTPLFFYDPLDRLARTEFPDGTTSRTAFDAWTHSLYDRNDTVADSLWYTNRINRLIDAELLAAGKDPAREQKAAEKTFLHRETPSVVHLNAQGKSIAATEFNRWQRTGEAVATEEPVVVQMETDVEGNVRAVKDGRGNQVALYKYDMLGNRVYVLSADTGERHTLQNIAGDPVRIWNARGFEFSFTYDILRRPVAKKVKGGDGPAPLDNVIENIIYGEGRPDDKLLNLRTKVAILYDTAGKTESEEYDFKGNLLRSTQRFATQYKEVADWSGADPDTKLDDEAFSTIISYDALNRIQRRTTPDGSEFVPEYSEANLLNRVQITQDGNTETFIKNIDYNEKGQRSRITYGNDITTTYFYDRETFRLLRLATTTDDATPLQDFHYTFDPAGNITHIQDTCIPTVFFNNQKITGIAEYTYDALYRLVEAKGREHIGQVTFNAQDNWNDAPFLKQYSPNDAMAWRNYTQQYSYDRAGNITQMKHEAQNGAWTRDFKYAADNNRLLSSTVGAETYDYTPHPKHGFTTTLPHLQTADWNFNDEIRATARQSAGQGTPETTWYVYNGRGQRVRRITEREAAANVDPSKKSQRFYIEDIEIYREYDNTGTTTLERSTLHVMDNERRVAMIETRTQGNDGSPARLVRYQFANHLNSSCIETDEGGDVISYEEFHPFGTTSYYAVDKDIKAAAKRYRYTGMERDEESGLNYHGARYYAPWLARWMSADPLGIEPDLNVFSYCYNNPVAFSDQNGKDPTPDQRRFREIYRETGNNAAETLIRAFTDAGISGATPQARFRAIMSLTSDALVQPTHFNAYTVTGTGDTGFRREFRDSVQYHPDASGRDITLHPSSSNQIGHFLTAADMGFSIRLSRDAIEADERMRREHIFLWSLSRAGSHGMDPMSGHYMIISAYLRAMVGHELIPDGGQSYPMGGASQSIRTPTSQQIADFEADRLSSIVLNTSLTGNSYQDLYLTRVGMIFGERMEQGFFRTNQEAADWLRMMLTTDVDPNTPGTQGLETIPAGHRFYNDAQWMNRMLQQFRTTQPAAP